MQRQTYALMSGAPGLAVQGQQYQQPQQYVQMANGQIVPLAGGQLVQQASMQPAPMPGVPQGQQTTLFRYGETTYYSTYFWPGGTPVANQQFRFFTTPLNQVGQGFSLPLSFGETNILTGGSLPQSQALDVFGIALEPMFSTEATDSTTASLSAACSDVGRISDLLSFQQNMLLQWKFSQTTVDVAVAELIGAGGGAFGALSTTVNAERIGHLNSGAATVFLYRDYGVTLPGLTAFALNASFGSRAKAIGTFAMAARCVLLGQYKYLIDVA